MFRREYSSRLANNLNFEKLSPPISYQVLYQKHSNFVLELLISESTVWLGNFPYCININNRSIDKKLKKKSLISKKPY